MRKTFERSRECDKISSLGIDVEDIDNKTTTDLLKLN